MCQSPQTIDKDLLRKALELCSYFSDVGADANVPQGIQKEIVETILDLVKVHNTQESTNVSLIFMHFVVHNSAYRHTDKQHRTVGSYSKLYYAATR
jgi:hypothetical protein